jgi:PAS domain S-box-containing protein
MVNTDARYRAVMETSMDGVVAVDGTGRIALANATLEQMFGYPPDELLGQPVGVLMADEPRDRHLARHLADANGGGLERQLGLLRDITARRKDGTLFPVDMALNLIECEGERIVRATVRDLTAHRLAERRRRQSEKMEAVGRLAGGVAHDFNNLLTVIIGCADLLLNQVAEDDPSRHELLQILEAADRAAAITQQLLAFGRRQMLMPVVVSLHGVVLEMAPILRRILPESIVLDVSSDAGVGHVLADRSQMEQVILNLVFNARDAMPAGGTVRMTLKDVEISDAESARAGHPLGPYVLLAVADTGVGMKPEVQEAIFEPFFTTRELGQGVGLGLASVHGIVVQSGGWIDVDSTEGAGTLFSVYLPRVSEPATA